MPSLRLLLVRLFPKIRGSSNKSPPPSSDKSHNKNGRRHAAVNISQVSSEMGKHSIRHTESWDGDQNSLVPLDKLDAEFLKSRAYINEMHEDEGNIDFEEVSGNRLSSTFTPAPPVALLASRVLASHRHTVL